MIQLNGAGYTGGGGCPTWGTSAGGGWGNIWQNNKWLGGGNPGPSVNPLDGYSNLGGGGGYRAIGTQGGTGATGGEAYGSADLRNLFFGAGGGGSGCERWGDQGQYNRVGENGGGGGGIIHIMADVINFSGSIEAKGNNGQYNRNAGGSGGSVRIEGEDITLNTIYVDGGSLAAPGAPGRIAIYYASTFFGNFTPGYLLNTTTGILDSISNNNFEAGFGDMISSSPSDPNLGTSSDSAYWGYSGLDIIVSNDNNFFLQDDAPDGEKYYRARFYMNIDGLSMATNDQFNYVNGLSGTNGAFKVQIQKITAGKQIRLVINTDGGSTLATSWYDLTSGWHALEIQVQAAGAAGANDGTASLYLDGVLKQTLTGIDNDTLSVDSVRMGAVYGIDTGTRGTIYFDEFDSRRFSAIGLLPDPGSQNPIPTPEPGFTNAAYTYSDEKPHAVTSVDRSASTDTYTYDANGNMTCRVEAGQTYVQSYNVENRVSTVLLVSGTCAENGTLLAGWAFTYDGDGSRVKQVYTDETSTLTTFYFAGGAYEVRDDGTTGTVWKYYGFAGMTVAVNDGSGLKYLLTDHLGSIVAVTDASGALLSEQRYMPFGQVRTDVGSITQTDFGYTGQRNLDAQQNVYSLGLMDYKARFYDSYITHLTQPDSIVPDLYNPQSLNRYSYVNNNPIRYTDPTGHCIDEGDAPPNSPAKRNICPKRETLPPDPTTTGGDGFGGSNGGDSSTIPLGGDIPYDCWGEYPCISDGSILPPTVTLHPLQGNVMSQVPIYDNNYHPPKLIGYRVTSYAYDNIHVDPLSFLPIPKDSISTASLIYYIGEKITKPGLDNLASVGIVFACPECAIGLKVIFFLHDVNDAITFDAHLRSQDIYFYSSPLMFSTITFDQFPYNLENWR